MLLSLTHFVQQTICKLGFLRSLAVTKSSTFHLINNPTHEMWVSYSTRTFFIITMASQIESWIICNRFQNTRTRQKESGILCWRTLFLTFTVIQFYPPCTLLVCLTWGQNFQTSMAVNNGSRLWAVKMSPQTCNLFLRV